MPPDVKWGRCSKQMKGACSPIIWHQYLQCNMPALHFADSQLQVSLGALDSAFQPIVSAFRWRTWNRPSWLHMWGGLAAQRPSRTSQSGKCHCCTTAVEPLRRSWSAHDVHLLSSLLSVLLTLLFVIITVMIINVTIVYYYYWDCLFIGLKCLECCSI